MTLVARPPAAVKGRCEPPLRSGSRWGFAPPLTPAVAVRIGVQAIKASALLARQHTHDGRRSRRCPSTGPPSGVS